MLKQMLVLASFIVSAGVTAQAHFQDVSDLGIGSKRLIASQYIKLLELDSKSVEIDSKLLECTDTNLRKTAFLMGQTEFQINGSGNIKVVTGAPYLNSAPANRLNGVYRDYNVEVQSAQPGVIVRTATIELKCRPSLANDKIELISQAKVTESHMRVIQDSRFQP